MSGKPAAVEVGQRWKCAAGTYAVAGQRDGKWSLRWEPSGDTGAYMFVADEILGDKFLGWAPGYGPGRDSDSLTSPSAPAVQEGKPKHRTNALCGLIECDNTAKTDRDLDGYVYCSKHESEGRWVDTREPKATKPKPEIPASCQLERWDETGPLTALQVIQARKKPEPWVPTVDDWDLLPDAGR